MSTPTDSSYATSKYKVVQGLRMNDVASRNTAITAYSNGHPGNMTVSHYFANLHSYATEPKLYYPANDDKDKTYDCSGYLKLARQAGYHGSTSNFCNDTAYFGYIELKNDGTRNYDKLIPGMELHQACRKSADSNYYYSKHIGVYYGKYDFGDGVMRHAVYQSCSSNTNIKTLTNKSSGPNLTSMTDKWTYWAWSKYIRLG